MKDKKDTITTIGVIAKNYDSFRVWRTEYVTEGPSARFVFIDISDGVRNDMAKYRFDGIVCLPCCYHYTADELNAAITQIKDTQFRASVAET